MDWEQQWINYFLYVLVLVSYLEVPDPGSKGGTLVKVLNPRQSDRRFVRSDAICGLGLFLVLPLAPRGLFTIQSGLLDENNHSVGALPLNH